MRRDWRRKQTIVLRICTLKAYSSLLLLPCLDLFLLHSFPLPVQDTLPPACKIRILLSSGVVCLWRATIARFVHGRNIPQGCQSR